MTNVAQKIAQRDALNREIAELQHQEDACFGRRLDALYLAVEELAGSGEYYSESGRRKNTSTLTVGGVTVSFSYPDSEYSTGLNLRTEDGLYVDFNGPLPSVNVLKALVSALLEDDGNDNAKESKK
jgi:hypothetical protein